MKSKIIVSIAGISLIIAIIKVGRINTETKTYFLDDGTKVPITLRWDKSNNLIYEIYSFTNTKSKTKNIGYFKKGNYIEVDGMKYLKQEADFEKSKILGNQHPEYYAVYSRNKNIIFTETDENGNGKIDSKSYYKNNMIYMSEISSKRDGRFDIWEYYKNGKPVRSEYDSDGDGKPDKPGIPPPSPGSVITK